MNLSQPRLIFPLITLVISLASPVVFAAGKVNENTAVVFKSPTCGCCTAWIEHLKSNGFDVIVREPADLDHVKSARAIPHAMRSCHTADIGAYTIEGHVPAEDIRRLLTEQPEATGLAVPGMPVGSPGMEQGTRHDPYDVILFGQNNPKVFAHH